jgi:hypothetical protein
LKLVAVDARQTGCFPDKMLTTAVKIVFAAEETACSVKRLSSVQRSTFVGQR